MKTIHITENAVRNHEELFPNLESKLQQTDPEFIELFDNWAFDEVIYDQTPAHSFLRMLDPQNGLAPGDPARMAARIIESVDVEPAPLRMVLGSQALEGTLATLRKRIADFQAQTQLAASTDFPSGE